MTWLKTIAAFLQSWTGSVAAAIIAGFDRVASPRVIRLIEQADARFLVETAGKSEVVRAAVTIADGILNAPQLAPLFKGSRVEIVLQSKRFLFRPLELPARATDFLEGIVRAQIDRLTPWSASEAVFGCSRPIKGGAETITAVIAAAPRKVAMGYVNAISGFHPAAVAVWTEVTGYDVGRVKVFEQKARGHFDRERLGRGLMAGIVAVAIAALLSALAAAWVSDRLGAEEDDLALQIAQRRAVIRANTNAGDRSANTILERRKLRTPASVVVLDELSQVLPDHTYVTELHLADDKLQIVGITGDAPSLISLIEKSAHFSRATFYAPTTRAASDPGERFHIEVQILQEKVLNGQVEPTKVAKP
jgi:general secretion pathway protein L